MSIGMIYEVRILVAEFSQGVERELPIVCDVSSVGLVPIIGWHRVKTCGIPHHGAGDINVWDVRVIELVISGWSHLDIGQTGLDGHGNLEIT